METDQRLTYESVEKAADFVSSKIPNKPRIGIICGSGLGSISEVLENTIDIPYSEIPDYPECSVQGHDSILTYGTFSNIPVLCFRGRLHIYEGYSLDYIVLPIRLLKLLGAELVVLTNAAGALNEGYAVGDIMLFKDHINFAGLSGASPIKAADERWGPKFFNVTYDKGIRDKAKEAFNNINFEGKVHEGVYVCLGGPTFETVAETKMMKLIGGDAVGMSTTHEALAAMHCGLRVLAFSVLTDIATSEYDSDKKITHQETLEICKQGSKVVQNFLENYIKSMEPANTAEEPVEVEVDIEVEEVPEKESTNENGKEEQKEEQKKKKSCACKDNPYKKK